MTERQLRRIINEEINSILNEDWTLYAKRDKNGVDVYHNTYTSAVNSALDYAREKGYEVDDEDIEREVTYRGGKPRPGQTAKHKIGLYKNGTLQRKYLQFQVYNMGNQTGNTFELNLYIQ